MDGIELWGDQGRFLGAALLFGGVQLVCLAGLFGVRRIAGRESRIFFGFLLFYTLLLGVVDYGGITVTVY